METPAMMLEDAQAEISRLCEELERERIRLAACTTAALGNTPEQVAQRITPEHPYWSASYGDVCRAVDREMAHREALADLVAGVRQFVAAWEAEGAVKDTFHATMGSGWKACARELKAWVDQIAARRPSSEPKL